MKSIRKYISVGSVIFYYIWIQRKFLIFKKYLKFYFTFLFLLYAKDFLYLSFKPEKKGSWNCEFLSNITRHNLLKKLFTKNFNGEDIIFQPLSPSKAFLLIGGIPVDISNSRSQGKLTLAKNKSSEKKLSNNLKYLISRSRKIKFCSLQKFKQI